MKHYGIADGDHTAWDWLEQHLAVNNITPVYIVHHPRRPLDAKQCQWPGSLRVQAVLENGTTITAIQLKPGGPARIER